MNLLLCPGVYPPYQRAGSEIYLHKIAKYLQGIGHDIKVLAHAPDGDYEYDGIDVYKCNPQAYQSDNVRYWNEANLVLCQLSGTPYVMNKMRIHQKQIVNIAHNNSAYAQIPLRRNISTIYNCHNTAKEVGYEHETIVCAPPIFKEHFRPSQGSYITLVNHNEAKGGKILIEIAKRMPEKQFMAVHGGYYDQIKDESVPNIKYVPMVEDIREVLDQTRIMIAPSEYESYGQAQVEALCSGIPVIATDLPGFRESLGNAATFITNRNNIDGWCDTINIVEKYHESESKTALERASELTPDEDLSALAIWLEKISNLAWI